MAQLAHVSSQASYGGYMKEYDKEGNYNETLLPSRSLLPATSKVEVTRSLHKTRHAGKLGLTMS